MQEYTSKELYLALSLFRFNVGYNGIPIICELFQKKTAKMSLDSQIFGNTLKIFQKGACF